MTAKQGVDLMTLISDITADAGILASFRLPTDPRARMAACLPGWLQPFLTWLTAKPAPGEVPAGRSAESFVAGALGWILAGCMLSLCPFLWPEATLAIWVLLPIGLTATCCGLGLFQVVV